MRIGWRTRIRRGSRPTRYRRCRCRISRSTVRARPRAVLVRQRDISPNLPTSSTGCRTCWTKRRRSSTGWPSTTRRAPGTTSSVVTEVVGRPEAPGARQLALRRRRRDDEDGRDEERGSRGDDDHRDRNERGSRGDDDRRDPDDVSARGEDSDAEDAETFEEISDQFEELADDFDEL